MTEEWRAIPGHEGLYEVSNLGNVRRSARINGMFGAKKTLPAKMLSISINEGYKVAKLCPPGSNSRGRAFYIEKAVLQLFPEMGEEPEALPGEEWRDIRGYEGLYQISNFGRILSMDRVIDDGQGRNRFIRRRLRMPNADGGGYPKVELARDGGTSTILVHRLVADAFVPNPLGLDCVHHMDEDKGNCRASNLEWTTRGGNVQDWFDRRRVVITVETIERIVTDAAAGKSAADILMALPRKRKRAKGYSHGSPP